MSKVELLKKEIKSLIPEELKSFREWFFEFDSDTWDRQIAEDSENGKLDSPAEEALTMYNLSKSTQL